MACRLLLAVWLVLAMWAGLIGSVWLATVVVLAMRSIHFRVYCPGSFKAAAHCIKLSCVEAAFEVRVTD